MIQMNSEKWDRNRKRNFQISHVFANAISGGVYLGRTAPILQMPEKNGIHGTKEIFAV